MKKEEKMASENVMDGLKKCENIYDKVIKWVSMI